ncbi:MAG: universal stress protein [Candidatus Methanoperedens sp.]|nr:universal stress protein [Candidatus Methanoperedens sp.]
MGTLGRNVIEKFLLGSVADKVIRNSSIPGWLQESNEMIISSTGNSEVSHIRFIGQAQPWRSTRHLFF